MSTKRIDKAVGVVTTANNTQTTALTYSLPNSCVAGFEIVVTGREQSTNDCVAVKISGGVRCSSGGTASLLTGSPVVSTIGQDAGVVLTSATVDANSNNLRVRVTGENSKSIDWMANADITLYDAS